MFVDKVAKEMREYLCVVGRGFGQVMFQNNALSGGLMWVAIACHSWLWAILALAGNLTGTLTAVLSGYDKADIRDGLYGFNGTLVGIAIGVFWKTTPGALFLLVVGSALSTWIARCGKYQQKVPAYTAPFILAVWLMLALCRWMYPSVLLPSVPGTAELSADWLGAFCLNIGQVMFLGDNLSSGLLFLLAIVINSRVNAVYTLLGAVLPLLMFFFADQDYTAFNSGLWGYNAVLCAIALGTGLNRSAIWAVLAIVLSVGLQAIGLRWGWVTLTAPFVLATWLVLGIRAGCEKLHKRRVS